MAEYVEKSGNREFSTVQEFWESDIQGNLPGPTAFVVKSYGFLGQLSKGLTDDVVNTLRKDDIELSPDNQSLCITVRLVQNPCRPYNPRRRESPPATKRKA